MADERRFTVMGAGEVGYHLARTLSHQGHSVTLIDSDPEKRDRIEEELDVEFVVGNGAHIPILERARVAGSELFIAASSSEEANLTASIIAKDLGARRTAVRLATAEDLTTFRGAYERLFSADLLLSPQILATHYILNIVLGHNTYSVDYLAKGRIQLRKIEVQAESPLTQKPLRQVKLPTGSRIVGYFGSERGPDNGQLTPANAEQAAVAGRHALVLCRTDAIRDVERLFASRLTQLGTVVIAGGGGTGVTIGEALLHQVRHVKLIERQLKQAQRIADAHPGLEVIHGDATDAATLKSERVGEADALIAATGHDESNLMTGLIGEELGVKKLVALVERSETSRLWRRLGTVQAVSPRFLAADFIRDYIKNGYRANHLSLEDGALEVIQRTLFAQSPVVGASLADLNPPRGLLVGAIARGDKIFVPAGKDLLLAGDHVVLFVHQSEAATARLLFPGPEGE